MGVPVLTIASRFRAIVLTTGVIASALAFYSVSLHVSTERSAVERLRRGNAKLVGDIRQLRSELGTRARLPQLERWNASVLALGAPKAGQYLDGAVELAAFSPVREPGMEARVREAVLVAPAEPAKSVQPVQVATAPAPARSADRAEVITVAFRDADAADTGAAARPALPLLHNASYDAPAAAAKEARRLLSSSVMSEIRAAAAKEVAGQ